MFVSDYNFISLVMENNKKRKSIHAKRIKSIELDHSSDNEHEHRNIKFPPLGLNKEQLMERLNTLKDYPTYKRTKAKRINLQEILDKEQTNITDTALAFGSREGKNEVLIEFIQENKSCSGDALNKFQEMFEDSKRRRIKPKLSQ